MKGVVLSFVFAVCVTLATDLAPTFQKMDAKDEASYSPLAAVVGDSRRLFANQFFVMADVYFHSGYYPTIFDTRKSEGPTHLDVASHSEPGESKSKEPDDDDKFLGLPKDWIEQFGRNFFPTNHTHLENTSAREILPWLKLSAEMDPKRTDTYVTASYWLRTRLGRADEAEEFLRQGLRANPGNYDILLELGRVCYYNKKNYFVARNLWLQALKDWRQQDKDGKNPDEHSEPEIVGELVRDDQRSGDLKQELVDLEELERISPGKATVQQTIDEVKAKLAQPSGH